jgi:DNA repair photolyase
MTDTSSSYTENHAKYYAKHKDTIASKEKEARRWVEYYEKNKDAVKKRNLERYHKKREEYFKSPEYQAEVKRMEELNTIVARLTELIPEVMKAPRRRRQLLKLSKTDETEVATT